MDKQNNFIPEEEKQSAQEQSQAQDAQAPFNDYQAPYNNFSNYQAPPEPPKSPKKKRGGIGVAAVICIIVGSLIIGSVVGVSVVYSLDGLGFNNCLLYTSRCV